MRESTGRAMRINELRGLFREMQEKDENNFFIEKKLIAQLSLKWNVAIRKVKEYITLLIDAEEIIKTTEGLKLNAQ